LIELAASSSDPWTVWLGVRECDARLQAPQGCAVLTWRRLATLDADNGAMWLELAAHDAAAVDEAMYQATRAQRFDSYAGRLAAAVEAALPAELSPVQRTATWSLIVHDELLGPLGGMQAASRYCSEANVRDANRAQSCEGLARRLVERGRDYMTASIGHGIGARLGWSGEARQAMRDEQSGVAARSLRASAGRATPRAMANARQQSGCSSGRASRWPNCCAARNPVRSRPTSNRLPPRRHRRPWCRRWQRPPRPDRAPLQPVLRSPAAMPLIDRWMPRWMRSIPGSPSRRLR
jgi:hypothetical protein